MKGLELMFKRSFLPRSQDSRPCVSCHGVWVLPWGHWGAMEDFRQKRFSLACRTIHGPPY